MMTDMIIKRTGLTGKSRFAVIVWAVVLSLAFPAPMATGQATGEGGCRFSDVPATSPAHADITYACRQGWFSGYPDGSFRPDRSVPAHQLATVVGRAFAVGSTRADMATFLRGGAPGDPAAPAGFSDVPATHPQSEDIAYAVERSWFQGYPDDTFRPDRTITTRQITTVLTRAFPTASTRAQLATFMRNGRQSLNAVWAGKTIVYVTEKRDADGFSLWASRGGGSEGTLLADHPYIFVTWDWPPGESEVVYSVLWVDEGSNGTQVWAAEMDGSGSRLLIDWGIDWGWSPDGARFFYTLSDLDEEGMWAGSELRVADGDGSDARLVASAPELVYGLQWSPAGDRFAYTFSSSDDDVSFKLWVADRDGSGSYKIEEAWTIFDTWGWSSEGRLAYTTIVWDEDRNRWIEYELWADDGRGTEARFVVKHTEVIYGVRWSPMGDRIAYRTVRDTGGGAVGNALRVVAADGSGPVLLTNDLFKANSWAWSPDGGRIAYETNEGLRTANGDGSGMRRLTEAPGGVWGWSPDGERLAYRSGGEVWVEGSEKRLLAGHPSDIVSGGWSPDGESFAYTVPAGEGEANELWIVGLDGSEPRRLADNVGERWEWSADGDWIAYSTPLQDAGDPGLVLGPARELWMVGAGGAESRLLSSDAIDWAWRPADDDIYNFRRPYPAEGIVLFPFRLTIGEPPF